MFFSVFCPALNFVKLFIDGVFQLKPGHHWVHFWFQDLNFVDFQGFWQHVSGLPLHYSKISQNAERHALLIDLKTTDFISLWGKYYGWVQTRHNWPNMQQRRTCQQSRPTPKVGCLAGKYRALISFSLPSNIQWQNLIKLLVHCVHPLTKLMILCRGIKERFIKRMGWELAGTTLPSWTLSVGGLLDPLISSEMDASICQFPAMLISRAVAPRTCPAEGSKAIKPSQQWHSSKKERKKESE